MNMGKKMLLSFPVVVTASEGDCDENCEVQRCYELSFALGTVWSVWTV